MSERETRVRGGVPQGTEDPSREAASVRGLLDRPISGVFCLASWVIATALFFGMIALLGGPSEADASETVYTTWAIAHGDVACAYSSNSATTMAFLPQYEVGPLAAPLWPLVAGGVAATTRLGHEAPFPTSRAMGAHCENAYDAMYAWSGTVNSLLPTTGIGYASWFALLAGVIALLRAAGRGRCGWEAMGVILVGATPIVWMPLLDYFHPEDILAMGLLLGGLACFGKRRWVWAGILLGLAVTSQPFALLALMPLVAVAPAAARRTLVASSALSWSAVALPFVVVTSGRAFDSVVFGTGDGTTYGGTILWETGVRGGALTFFSRVVPVLIALALAWWVGRQLGPRVLQPVPLLSLVATCLSLRLVFEKGLFGYKFMALAVMLILLAVVRRRISAALVGWLALVTMAFNPVPSGFSINARPWGTDAALGFDVFCMAAAVILIAWDAFHQRTRWYLVGGLALAVWAFSGGVPMTPHAHAPLPLWLWQVVLLGGGVALACAPLADLLRGRVAAERAPQPSAIFATVPSTPPTATTPA